MFVFVMMIMMISDSFMININKRHHKNYIYSSLLYLQHYIQLFNFLMLLLFL